MHVAGVSFHVGSGCGDPAAYSTALCHTRAVFDMAESFGMVPMTIVNIGGGFPGDTGGYGGPNRPTFVQLAATVRESIAKFGDGLNRPLNSIRFMAEPGRYFVSASTTIATKVYARKGGSKPIQALYVDDGVYGSFNNVIYDHATPLPTKINLSNSLNNPHLTTNQLSPTAISNLENSDTVVLDRNAESESDNKIPTAVFGPTCDGLDQMCSMEKTMLPRCEIGDWLTWPNMGAYTHTASFVFNGYTHIPAKTYCINRAISY